MKVSELEGAELDYWVYRAMGYEEVSIPSHWSCESTKALAKPEDIDGTIMCWDCTEQSYSTDWYVGGPLIEKEKISTTPLNRQNTNWQATIEVSRENNKGITYGDFLSEIGPTLLIASMRAYVSLKFGEEVE